MTSFLCSRSSALGRRGELLDLLGDGVGVRLELGVGHRDPVRPHLALDPAADVVGEHADRADRVAEADVAEAGELLADRLHRRERDEAAHHVVGALEDREDPDVAQDLLVGVRLHVPLAAAELHRAVGRVPEELGPGRPCRSPTPASSPRPPGRRARRSGTPSTPARTGRRPSSRSSPGPARSRRSADRTGARSLTWSIARSSSFLAAPTEPVPRPIRPLLRIDIAIRKPSPGSPSTFSAGTLTSLK